MRAVLDTNVLVSGLLSIHAPPARIVDLLRAGDLEAVVDDRILAEYEEVLHRERLRPYLTAADAEDILDFLRHAAVPVICTRFISGLPDPDDAPFLEVALAASVPLITGNLRHFPAALRQGSRVLSPRDFLTEWARHS